MGKLVGLVRVLLKQVGVRILFLIILGIFASFFLQVLGVAHFDVGLALGFDYTVVKNEGMLVFNGILCKLLADQSFDLLEYLNIVLSNNSDSTTSLASTRCPANTVHIIFRVAWNVEVDDDVNRRNVKATGCNICRDQYVPLICLELIQRIQSLLLRQLTVDVDSFEVQISQHECEFQ